MNFKKPMHNFHIPVMGVSYTIDSPIRVAHYGIDSVISIVDDELLEKMTAFYADKFHKPYLEITKKVEDFRAKRITRYLDLVDEIVKEKMDRFKSDLLKKREDLETFLKMLPSNSELSQKINNLIENGKSNVTDLQSVIDQYLHSGNIDVNIMTKVDKDNFQNGEQLPVEYNDAHAALRGFAQSKVKSSIIFSAGMNPRLYSYLENFEDFYPDEKGEINKKIILKVSDYRSAIIQGNFLAKKGLWVSEYRIESGLNCGGHAFATEGLLLGPILEEFRNNKADLIDSTFTLLSKALEDKNKPVPAEALPIKITVQGGVGTAEEHDTLINYFQTDSVGWGTPFLLVSEATSVDKETRQLLAASQEKDLYLSNISPLGVPFNTIKGTTNEFFKQERIKQGKSGSSCPKKLLALSKELDPEGTCTASKKYQDIKLSELEGKKNEISRKEFERQFHEITEKSCLCVGLSNASLLENNIGIKGQKQGVVVCPGPNMAYFSKEMTLQEMMQHIYGKHALEMPKERPNFFIKELSLYVDYFKKQVEEASDLGAKQLKKLEKFRENLLAGIDYYTHLFSEKNLFSDKKEENLAILLHYKNELSFVKI